MVAFPAQLVVQQMLNGRAVFVSFLFSLRLLCSCYYVTFTARQWTDDVLHDCICMRWKLTPDSRTNENKLKEHST